MSKELEKAREYEIRQEMMIPREQRPLFHLTPRCGWMNDPNGFSLYKGEYHLFYQYHPYDTVWGPMHWGHAKSKDLISWKYLPCVMAPDQEYDSFGCFSGSAIEMEDGKHLIAYTGVRQEKDENNKIHEFQTQCIAIGDGINYEKYENNPVIDAEGLPSGAGKVDFRDPKIFKKDEKFYMIAGNKTEDKDGQILQFVSDDGLNWKYDKLLIKNEHRFGAMWECPDFFELDGKHILLTSPQDMLPEGSEFINGNGTLCVIGHVNQAGDYCEENFQAIDYGIDYYAPQTVMSQDGRRLMIGWMQNWDACGIRREDFMWFGQMCFPREISICNNRLIQRPVREIENYYGKTLNRQNVLLNGEMTFSGVQGRCLDLSLDVSPANDEVLYKKLEVRFADNGTFYSKITFDPIQSTVQIDRTHSGTRRALLHMRKCRVTNKGGKIKFRIILDRYSMELFINDGEQVMSMGIFTDLNAEGINFNVDGELLLNLSMHELVIKNEI